MSFQVHHIHIKSAEPKPTADWLMNAFGFTLVSDEVRAFGDHFIRLQDANQMLIMVSGPRTGEILLQPTTDPHLGLEHFGMQTSDLASDLARLKAAGANVVEGPFDMPGGVKIAFLLVPGEVRIELIERPAAK